MAFRSMLAMLAAASLCIAGCSAPSEQDSIAAAKADLSAGNLKSSVVHLKSALQKNPQSGEARFLLGRALFLSGNTMGALEELEKARLSRFDENQVLPLLARVQFAGGQPAKVVERFGESTLSDPKAAAELKAQVAGALLHLGKFDSSLGQVEAALKLDPTNEVARLESAMLAAKKGRFDDALERVGALASDSPKNAAAWTLRAELLWGAKSDVPGAVAAYRRALGVEPGSIPAHMGLLNLYRAQNDLAAFRAQVGEMKKAAQGALQTRAFETELALLDNDLERARAGVQELLRAAPQSPQVLLLAGNVAMRTGANAQARTHFAQAVQLRPTDPAARRWLATVLLRSGQATEALVTLKPLLDQPDPGPEVLEVAAQASLQNGDAAKAEAYYARAATARPDDPKARVALLVMRISRGEAAAGIAALEALASSDKGTSADMALISLYLARNDADAALRATDRLQEKLPNEVMPHLLRGRILNLRGDAAGARASLEKALSIDPTHFVAVAELGALDLAENKVDAARMRYEALLAREPRNHRALLALAAIQQRAGAKPEDVEALIARAVAANPFDPAPRAALVEHRLQRRQLKEAMAAAQEAVAALPDDLGLLEVLGRAQLAAGDSQQALATFRKVAESNGAGAETYLRVARLYAGMRNYDAASEVLRKALKATPNMIEAQETLIDLALAKKRPAEALEIAKQVQKQRPTEAVGHLLESTLLAKQRRWEPAIAAAREALARERSTKVAIHLHGLYTAAGNQPEAAKFADAWRRDRPSDVHFIAHLGSVSLGGKDYAAAEAQYRAAVAALPGSASMLNNLAWALVLQGKPEAVTIARKATELSPNVPAYMDTLSQALRADKQPAAALDWARKAVASAPDRPQYRLNLAKLLIETGDRTEARAELQKLSALGGRFASHADVTRLLATL